MNKSAMAKWRIKYNLAQIAISLPKELRTSFREVVRKNDTNMNEVLVAYIAAYVKENE